MNNALQLAIDLPFLAAAFLKITIILMMAWGFHVLARRANARWRVLLWRAAIVAVASIFILDPMGYLEIPVRLAEVRPEPSVELMPGNQQAAPFEILAPVEAPEPVQWSSPEPVQSFAPSVAFPPLPPSVESPVQPQSAPPLQAIFDWRRLLLPAYLAVLLVLVARILSGLYQVRRVVASAERAPQGLQDILDRVARELGYERGVSLRYSSDTRSPFLANLTNPTIVLPERMIEPACEADLPAVFAHEVAHLCSHDLFWMGLSRWAGAFLWFHPLAWQIQRAHHVACEEHCDASAADYIGDKAAYSGILARVALAVGSSRAQTFGMPMAKSSEVGHRLRSLKLKAYSARLSRPSLGLCFGLFAGLVLMVGGLRIVRSQDEGSTTAAGAKQDESAEITTQHAITGNTIRGTVLRWDDGSPVGGAMVFLLEGWSTARVSRQTRTNADGRFEFLDAPKTIVYLMATKPELNLTSRTGGSDHARRLNLRHSEDTEHELAFLLGPGRIADVHILSDATGEPIAGASVNARGRPPQITDASGYVRLNSLIAGSTSLEANAPGYAIQTGLVNLRSTRRAHVEIRLRPGGTISGRAIDERGRPVAGLRVRANASIRYQSPTLGLARPYRRDTTQADGSFRFDSVPLDALITVFPEHEKTFSTTLYRGTAEAKLAASRSHAEVELELSPRVFTGTFEGHVVDAGGAPIEGARLTWGTLHDARMPEALTDSRGKYRLEHIEIPLFRSSLYVDASGYAPNRRVIKPGTPDKPVEVDFALKAGHWIEGRIVDPEGKPLEGVWLQGLFWGGRRQETNNSSPGRTGGSVSIRPPGGSDSKSEWRALPASIAVTLGNWTAISAMSFSNRYPKSRVRSSTPRPASPSSDFRSAFR